MSTVHNLDRILRHSVTVLDPGHPVTVLDPGHRSAGIFTRIWRGVHRGEEGRILLLGLGACVLLSALILMSLTMSGIYLEQRRLVRLAEQVATVSAGEIDAGLYYQQGVTPGEELHLDQAGAEARAREFLGELEAADLGGLERVELADFAVEAHRVRLRLQAVGKIPLLLPGISDRAEVELRAGANASLKASMG